MAEDIDGFLKGARAQGSSDSEGGFTVNFAKAREKMARYQLADPHDFLLKLIQAGVLGAESIGVTFGKLLVVRYRGWSSELTLERISEQLCSGTVGACETPLEHLAVGLNALVGGVVLAQGDQVLRVHQELEWEEVDAGLEEGLLEVRIPAHDSLDRILLRKMLNERCGFAPIPIDIEGNLVGPRFPVTSGAHRPKYFRENKRVATRLSGAGSTEELWLGRGGEVRRGELRLTVDLDPAATIWVAKAGVLIEEKKVDLGVPGVVGVVEADDLRTDLTGVQVMTDDRFEELTGWLKGEVRVLLADALKATRVVDADSEPLKAQGRIAYKDGCVGCSMAFLGTWASCAGWGEGFFSDGLLTPVILFWVSFPGIWVYQSAYRHGCEKDPGSDLAAKQVLYDRLLDAANEVGVTA